MAKLTNGFSKKELISNKPSPDHIIFSYKYISSNNGYGWPALNWRADSVEIYMNLMDKMRQISTMHLSALRMAGKIKGSEAIPVTQFSDAVQSLIKNIPICTNHSKLDVIRFGDNKYRLICLSDSVHGNILHIICFDLDYSAYDHG